MVVSPVKDGPGAEGSGGPLSLREMVHSIDNERDFQHYVVSHTSNVPSRPPEIRYEKHPVGFRLVCFEFQLLTTTRLLHRANKHLLN